MSKVKFTRPFPIQVDEPISHADRAEMWRWMHEQVRAGAMSRSRYELLIDMDYSLMMLDDYIERYGNVPIPARCRRAARLLEQALQAVAP